MGLQWVRFSHRRSKRAFVHIKQEELHIVFRDQRFGFACEGGIIWVQSQATDNELVIL